MARIPPKRSSLRQRTRRHEELSEEQRGGMAEVTRAYAELLLIAQGHFQFFEQDHRRFKEIAEPITDELDTLTIKRLVPGHCKYCPI